MTNDKLNQRLKSLASVKSQTSAPLPMAKKPPAAKKDRATRQGAYKLGEIDCLDGEKLGCLLLDLSNTGARVKMNWATALPRVVRLFIPSSGIARNAKVCWQIGAETGLEFLD